VLRQFVFVMLVFVVAFAATVVVYLMASGVYPWANYYVCYLRS
jgi:hypothetical protein